MKKTLPLLLLLMLALALPALAQAAPFQRGINLGNVLEAPVEGAWGLPYDPAWAPIIADAGFDFVRLPVQFSAHIVGADHQIDPAFLTRIDYVLSTLLDQGLGVLLDLHHYDAFCEDPEGQADRLYAIWAQLAARYARLPDESLWFEVLNEPRDPLTTAAWNPHQNECIRLIREVSPTRPIVVQAAQWGSYSDINALVLPRDPNLVLSFHYYDPFLFTHQGADWADLSGQDGVSWGDGPLDRPAIESVFRGVRAWSDATGLPVLLGEFGVYRDAAMPYRVAWTETVRRTAERCGFRWSYWEFNSNFGVYDTDLGRMNQLLPALLPETPLTGLPAVAVERGDSTIGPARFLRPIDVQAEAWSGYMLSDTEDGAVAVDIVHPFDWGAFYLPLAITDTGAGFSHNTATLTLRLPDDSADDLCVNLETGADAHEAQLLWLDKAALNTPDESVAIGPDGLRTLTLDLSPHYETFAGRPLSTLRLKCFFESVPDRPTDRQGRVELLSLTLR